MAPAVLTQQDELGDEFTSNELEHSQGSQQAKAQGRDEALRAAGVQYPEDIAALEVAEPADLLAPADCANEEIQSTLNEAKFMLRKRALSKD